MPGITLDAGALIALDRNDRRVIALLARATDAGHSVTIPASALARATRNPATQARLSRLVRLPDTNVVPLDRVDAALVGRLLALSDTSDVVDAHVVICARRAQTAVATSDVEDLAALDPTMHLVRI